ncbi:MAG TPA: bifunctional phosphoserine phosphatase/homoserine phosphotransferase ThrH [Bacteroidales bacterium]|nr:bifunctional phosphoserine phosphatase/homoserine phosphotransferase ThrH [Bacteroidales bacterium]
MHIVCSDLEGVFVPEIWIGVSRETGIDELKLTTRDISDYDVLMKRRIGILKENGLKLKDIQNVISKLRPLPGALEFLNWLRTELQVIIVSDTFTEFAGPLMKQLGYPSIFCHNLITDSSGSITGYKLRQTDSKKKVAAALQSLNYGVIAVGDSYNDLSMIRQANKGVLFNPPDSIAAENKDLKVVSSYDELKKEIELTINNSF